MQSQKDTTVNDAESTAVSVLAWLAGEPEHFSRFLSLTGMAPADLRAAAGNRSFLAGLVEFLMGHEPTLMAFCAATETKPETVVRAHAMLTGGANAGGW
ncbi:DUF3572 domain-containing protein [Mycoplana rhizolycopersici]|jgi:hypothetical protein|uniref:DUF3572 domain-containing protein n=1 Tax=Mycoplana rhizolycopersici TaxID=2746702 RepID=A0ABX2Q9Z4_9HYPH|nr:DUF3572 domain-containing protein [Rhizobium rhizolycopersici]NVP54552.1 DUF3572 domain-containing protein [Rhizobium rhizolycopersici]